MTQRTLGSNPYESEQHEHRAPSDCPVCGQHLSVTRLGCTSCGTELAGLFASCPFCSLGQKDLDLLRVFLTSRGNMREVEKHLGVSYPTARQRFGDVLAKLGLADEQPSGQSAPAGAGPAGSTGSAGVTGGAARSREEILAEVAAGTLSPAEAQRLLVGA